MSMKIPTAKAKKLKRILSFPASAKWRTTIGKDVGHGLGKPSVFHAVVVIFLEFFSWGLLTSYTIMTVGKTFPEDTFLMNGLVYGMKGLLSFLSAPLIGALSDAWGRKSFLLVTVFFTCIPIPILLISSKWFFFCVALSGMFSATFSVVFAYVADCTIDSERNRAYGVVSATFAGSLIISPALGDYLTKLYGETFIVGLSTVVFVLDLVFILLVLPESLPEKLRSVSWGAPITWAQADPFSSLRKVGRDSTVLMLCITVFLSHLPEAGQYSSMFLYLKSVVGFGSEDVALYIAVVGLLSVLSQTILMTCLNRALGLKTTIMLALVFQILQLLWYGFTTTHWMMWAAGVLVAVSSMTFPSISALVSHNAEPEQQGVVQGIITGIRGLCGGIGPALFGFIFYMFGVDLSNPEVVPYNSTLTSGPPPTTPLTSKSSFEVPHQMPGMPFLFGAGLCFLSLLVAHFIPDGMTLFSRNGPSHRRLRSSSDSETSACPQAGTRVIPNKVLFDYGGDSPRITISR